MAGNETQIRKPKTGRAEKYTNFGFMNSTAPVAYSAILQDFIQPICNDNETEVSFYQKCEVGRTVWNYCVAQEFNLSIANALYDAITEGNERHPEMKPVVDLLIERKRAFFRAYTNFIVTIEQRVRPDGPSLYVESVPADKVEELLAGVKWPLHERLALL